MMSPEDDERDGGTVDAMRPNEGVKMKRCAVCLGVVISLTVWGLCAPVSLAWLGKRWRGGGGWCRQGGRMETSWRGKMRATMKDGLWTRGRFVLDTQWMTKASE
jgi:hypothetical protein